MCAVDFWDEPSIFKETLVYAALSEEYDVVEDYVQPQLVVYSMFGNSHEKYTKCVKLRVSGECDKEVGGADFYIGLNKAAVSDNYLWMPWNFYYGGNFYNSETLAEIGSGVRSGGDGVCFLASNHSAVERLRLLNRLRLSFKVDSGGWVFNNIGRIVGKSYEDFKNFYGSHKFAISCENQRYPGYLTEKLFIPLMFGCIPVYIGDPLVEEVVNPKCFINANDLSMDEVVEKMNEIDGDEELRMNMLCEDVLVKPMDYYTTKLSDFMKLRVCKKINEFIS